MKGVIYKFLTKRCGRREYLLTLVVLALICSALSLLVYPYTDEAWYNFIGMFALAGGGYFLSFLLFGSLLPLIVAGLYSVWLEGSFMYFIAMAALGLVYIVQGTRRCWNMGVSPWRMFIPVYMPIALLAYGKADREIDYNAKNCLQEFKAGNYRELGRMVLRFLSPKGKLSRMGFIYIFICAIVAIECFKYLTLFLWSLFEPMDWNVNFFINSYEVLGIFGLITGCVPIVGFILFDATYMSVIWGYEVGYHFLGEALIIDILYVLYLFQCVKRCHDIGRSWYYSFIPLYNPIELLWDKSVPSTDTREQDCDRETFL